MAAAIVLLSGVAAYGEDNPAVATKPEDQAIVAARSFAFAAVPGQCDERTADNSTIAEDHVYPLTWKDNYGNPPTRHTATLYEIFCFAGAYNVSDLYVMKDEADKLSLVAFATPTYDIAYVEGDDTQTKLKRDPVVTGYSSGFFLTNPSFDEKTQTLSEFGKWRGIGDAWSSGQWQLRDGQFMMTGYEIDPIFEANLDNPPAKLADKSYRLFPAPKRK